MTDSMPAGKKNTAIVLNKLLKAECGLVWESRTLGSFRHKGDSQPPTHRLFWDLTRAQERGWGQAESRSFPEEADLGEGGRRERHEAPVGQKPYPAGEVQQTRSPVEHQRWNYYGSWGKVCRDESWAQTSREIPLPGEGKGTILSPDHWRPPGCWLGHIEPYTLKG